MNFTSELCYVAVAFVYRNSNEIECRRLSSSLDKAHTTLEKLS